MNRHPEVAVYIDKISEILDSPDGIYREVSKVDTIWIVKTYSQNIKITVKLNTNILQNEYKNSIIQMQFMKDSKIDKYIKNGKIMKIYNCVK